MTFDTTILFKKKTIYKCACPECCKRTLKTFNDKSHELYTAMIFMINNNLIKSTLTKTKITFKNTRVSDINNYVNKNFKQVSKAVGCYNIEGKGNSFFKASSFSVLVPVPKTFASKEINLLTIDLPIPPVAPVIKTFLFLKLII